MLTSLSTHQLPADRVIILKLSLSATRDTWQQEQWHVSGHGWWSRGHHGREGQPGQTHQRQGDGVLEGGLRSLRPRPGRGDQHWGAREGEMWGPGVSLCRACFFKLNPRSLKATVWESAEICQKPLSDHPGILIQNHEDELCDWQTSSTQDPDVNADSFFGNDQPYLGHKVIRYMGLLANQYDKTFLIRRSSQNICLVRGLRPSLSQPMKGLFNNPWPIWSSRNWASEVVEVEQVECEIGGLETCLPFANFYSMFSTHFIQNSFQDSFHHIFNHI